jgi:hypothetical protein
MQPTFHFTAPLEKWTGESAWYLVSLPTDVASPIREMAMHGGFGSVKVQVTCGKTTWKTSLFRDTEHNTYLLFVKKAVREAEKLELAKEATYALVLV